MWYKKRVRYNPKKKEGQYYSISNKLKNQGKSNDEFEVMVSNLTLEDLIGLKLELSARAADPTDTFELPVVLAVKAVCPTAVFSSAVVFELSAEYPRAVL